ncbi:putative metalloprotease CJM1_0395 family protein [Magnetovibrio sp. PR-2]|uniref:putative metalloprotease CJM1_0395 family protein n=1 Tax=Magnetovibrio sp. PR-2 TaxID=3120356 RepID=UPI002FCE14B4
MLDAPIRAGLGSTDFGLKGPERPSPSQPPTPVSVNATPSGTVAAQGLSYASYVVAPDTLVQAQEARASQSVRRDDTSTTNVGGRELTDEQLQQLQELKKTDREVRAHERAHRSAGGTLTGPAQYEYVRGPDGQQYAVNGEVSIDVSRGNSASATVEKMEAVIRAALAPSNPSAQDIAVAAQARQILNEVSQEAQAERRGEQTGEQTGEQGSEQIGGQTQVAVNAYEFVQQQQEDASELLQNLSVVA